MVSIDDVKKFFKVLTWSKLWQFFIALIICASLITIWDNRTLIYAQFMPAKIATSSTHITELSSKSKEDIKNILDKSKKGYVVAVHITSVNFQKNTRKIIYFDSNIPELTELFEGFNKRAVSELPLFTQDTAANKRIIDMINGEFTCLKFTDVVAYKVEPRTGEYAKTMCIIAIPPYYGKFSGIVAVYLGKELTPVEISDIRLLAQGLANKIFENDVVR